MDKEKKKEELIGKLLGRYANSHGISIIKIGEGDIDEDTNKRLQKCCSTYRKQIKDLTLRMKEYQREIKDSKAAENIAIKEYPLLKIEVENLTKRIEESDAELKIRRQRDGRFDILDL